MLVCIFFFVNGHGCWRRMVSCVRGPQLEGNWNAVDAQIPRERLFELRNSWNTMRHLLNSNFDDRHDYNRISESRCQALLAPVPYAMTPPRALVFISREINPNCSLASSALPLGS
jgi:hypothetical protein